MSTSAFMAVAVSVQSPHHYQYGFLTDSDDLPQVLLRRGELLLGLFSGLAQSCERRLDLIRRSLSVVEHSAQLCLSFLHG